jgi:hypothetical protein
MFGLTLLPRTAKNEIRISSFICIITIIVIICIIVISGTTRNQKFLKAQRYISIFEAYS